MATGTIPLDSGFHLYVSQDSIDGNTKFSLPNKWSEALVFLKSHGVSNWSFAIIPNVFPKGSVINCSCFFRSTSNNNNGVIWYNSDGTISMSSTTVNSATGAASDIRIYIKY